MKSQSWLLCFCGGLVLCLCAPVVRGDYELVSESVLKQADLQSKWQIQLPLKDTESIGSLYVFDAYLYVLTDQNMFFCIERSTGLVRTLLSLAVSGLPILPPIHFENKSVFLIGQEIKVFDPVIGRITDSVRLSQLDGSSAGIARNSDTIFLCGSDNRLYAFSADEGVRLYMVTADNDSPIHSVIASDQVVWFATTAGNIVAMDVWSRQKTWQYNLTGKMIVPLLLDDGFLYAAGLDTKLYKLDSKQGQLAWKEPFVTGGAVREPLILGKNCIYVYTVNTGLYAIRKESGKPAWNLPQGRSILSELGDQCFVYNQSGTVTLMDNLTGKEAASIDVSGVERFAVNTIDSVLYLADKKGRVMAAHQIPRRKIGAAQP